MLTENSNLWKEEGISYRQTARSLHVTIANDAPLGHHHIQALNAFLGSMATPEVNVDEAYDDLLHMLFRQLEEPDGYFEGKNSTSLFNTMRLLFRLAQPKQVMHEQNPPEEEV